MRMNKNALVFLIQYQYHIPNRGSVSAVNGIMLTPTQWHDGHPPKTFLGCTGCLSGDHPLMTG